MLPKTHRLPVAMIPVVARKGRKQSSSNLMVKSLPNSLGIARICIVVSTKVDKRATIRNRIKRRIRAVLAELISPEKPIDLMIVVHNASLAEMAYPTLKEEISRLI